MNTRSKFPAFCLLLLSSFLCVSLPASAQTDPFSIRVESNLVLVHTEVYNTTFNEYPGLQAMSHREWEYLRRPVFF